MIRNVVNCLSVGALLVGMSALGNVLPAEALNPGMRIEYSAVGATYQQSNQACLQDFYRKWYAAAETCAVAGGHIVRQGYGQCSPHPGPSYNWESSGTTDVICSVPAFSGELVPWNPPTQP